MRAATTAVRMIEQGDLSSGGDRLVSINVHFLLIDDAMVSVQDGIGNLAILAVPNGTDRLRRSGAATARVTPSHALRSGSWRVGTTILPVCDA